MRRQKWVPVDSWAYVKGDAESKESIESTIREMKRSHGDNPNLRVRTFKRTIRAGGAAIPCLCIVAQVPATEARPGMSFVVTRDCCGSGNCISCHHLPYGRKTRLVQMRTKVREIAERTMRGWKDYNPALTETAS